MAELEVGVNSYVTVAEADDYLSLRHGADAWWAAHEDAKAQALVTATRRIGMQLLLGRKETADQSLAFPRQIWSGGRWVTVEAGWMDVLAAACEEALAIVGQSGWERQRERMAQAGVTEVSVGEGGAREFMAEQAVMDKVRGGAGLQSPEARQLLEPYMARGGRIV